MRPMLVAWVLAACSSSVPQPTAITVAPDVVLNDLDRRLVISADHLGAEVVFDLDRPSQSAVVTTFAARLTGPASVQLAEVAVVRAGVVQATLPAGAPPGTYTLELSRPNSAVLTVPDALRVVAP